MAKKRKSKIELRYYKMPAGIPILALLGQKWVRSYGEGIDYLHFHNCMEIGYCYEGKGIMTIGEKITVFQESSLRLFHIIARIRRPAMWGQ